MTRRGAHTFNSCRYMKIAVSTVHSDEHTSARAWQGHASGGNPFYYTLSIRDLRPTRDWSTEQRYRFCIEKAGNGCFEPPCENRPQPDMGVQDGGCSVPRR